MLQILILAEEITHSRSDVIAVIYDHFYHYGTTKSQNF